MKNLKLFWRSLKDHPGLLIASIWPLWVLMAILMRSDAQEIPIERIVMVVGLFGALPWIPVISTAWTGRHQYRGTK